MLQLQITTILVEGRYRILPERKMDAPLYLADAHVPSHLVKHGFVFSLHCEYKMPHHGSSAEIETMARANTCIVLLRKRTVRNEELYEIVARARSKVRDTWNYFQFFFETYEKYAEFVAQDFFLCDITAESNVTSHIILCEGVEYFLPCKDCTLLQNIKLEGDRLQEAVGDVDTCGVCLEKMRVGARSTIMLNCNHVFHSECLPPSTPFEHFAIPPLMEQVRLIHCPMCRSPNVLATNNEQMASFKPFDWFLQQQQV